jgi:benzoylformate decarboxylase
MAMMTGKRALIEMLRAEGVRYIFGNPGTTESPIMDELESHPDLKYVLVMQEGVAMGMADAYARATGRPSFVSLHIETGLANGISLLHNAHEGGTPIVLSSANGDVRQLAFGRTDLPAMVRPFTKWAAEVTHTEQIPTAVRRAFNEAKAPPTGPTYLGFSANALDGEADIEIAPSPAGYNRTAPDRRAIEDATALLAASDNPIMLIGDTVAQSQATGEAVRVAELLGARVYAAPYSEMCFPSGHPQFVGTVRTGHPEASEMLSKGDVVLVIGRLSTYLNMFSNPVVQLLGASSKLVHLDSDPGEVGKTQPTEVGIVGDPKSALAELGLALEAEMSGAAREAARGRSETLAAEKAARKAALQQSLEAGWDRTPMTPERMMAEVARALPSDTIVIDDSVTSRPAVMNALEFNEPGSMYSSRGGALGWGMGAPLGMKLANPERPVVAIVGDGNAMMTVQALWTAASENIPVVYVICNNGSYRVLKVNMDAYKKQVLKEKAPRSKYIGMDFPIPLNLAGIAEATGVYGRKIADPAELEPAMRHALDLGKPALLDVVIDGAL